MPQMDEMIGSNPSKWVMRFVLDKLKLTYKDLDMERIEKTIHAYFQNQFHVMISDTNAQQLVVRLRLSDGSIDDIDDSEEYTTCMMLKETMDKIANEMILKGFPEITKVSFSKYNENDYDPVTGAAVPKKDYN
jgi:hypothetical protein